MHAPGATFELTPGDEGLVMSVFTLPSLNVVFKVIKDSFGYPKRITRRDVMERYRLVFLRDRVGRLADAQEFEYLERVEFGKEGREIEPNKLLLEVTFASRWKVQKQVGERELREAEMRGYERAVNLLRQTGREELANELDRAYLGLQKGLPPAKP